MNNPLFFIALLCLLSASLQANSYKLNSQLSSGSINQIADQGSTNNDQTTQNSQFNGNNISINTGGNTTLQGQTLNAQGNIAINAKGNILLDSVTDSTSSGDKSRRYTEQTTHTTSKLNVQQGNISLNSEQNITLKGSALNANTIALNATGDIAIENVQNERYDYSRKKKSGWFSSSTTTTERLKRTNVQSQLNAKNKEE